MSRSLSHTGTIASVGTEPTKPLPNKGDARLLREKSLQAIKRWHDEFGKTHAKVRRGAAELHCFISARERERERLGLES